MKPSGKREKMITIIKKGKKNNTDIYYKDNKDNTMNKNQLRSLIKEELKKTLNEAASNTLPKEISVKHISGNKYLMYFSKFDWEPTMADLEKSIATIYKTLKSKDDLVGLIKITAKPSVFVIDGDVCIGDIFTSKLKPAEMDDAVGLSNDEY